MKDFLTKASEAYYKGTPIMSDAAFDILSTHFDFRQLGHKVTDAIPHYYRMYSLQNCFSLNDLKLPPLKCCITPKLDGAAISILYVGGKLSLALTRGDGKLGRDITDKIRLLVPNTIETFTSGPIQVNGEILAPSSVPNSRNFAAGSLNLKELEEFKTRPLVFVAYDLLYEGNHFPLWFLSMNFLYRAEFNTVTDFDVKHYPTDGWVYRIDDMKDFHLMGYTSHHPRGAVALKKQKKGEITILEDVIWQVGKSGVVSPVALLKPIKIGNATVSRATIHNIEYIKSLNLEIGCKVEVIRSGEIIPRIVRRV